MQTIIQPTAMFMQQLNVIDSGVTIGCMKEKNDLVSFAKRLNEICDDMDVPPKGKARQTALAKTFDVSQNGARKWLEAEGYPTFAMCQRIAEWADVSIEWFVMNRGPKKISLPALGAAIAQSAAGGSALPPLPAPPKSPLVVAASRIDRSPAIPDETKEAIVKMLQSLLK